MTPYDPQIHHRRSIRLPGYDYTQPGAYFVTLVTSGREWVHLPRHYPHAVLDAFMCMPNHVHGIVILRDDAGRGGSVPSKIVTPSKARSGELCAPDNAQTRPYETGKIVTPSQAHSGELCAPDNAQTRPYETGKIVTPSQAHSGELYAPDSARTRPNEDGDEAAGWCGPVSGKGLMQNEITSGVYALSESGQTRPNEATRHGLPARLAECQKHIRF